MRIPALFFLALTIVVPGTALHANQPELERDPDFLAGRAALDDGFYEVAAGRFEVYVERSIVKRKKAYGAVFLFSAWHQSGQHNRIIAWLREHWSVSKGTRYEAAFAYWYARAKYATGLHADTLEYLKNIETRFPGDEFLPYAFRLRGQALRESKRLEAAEVVFARYDAEYSDRDDIPENLLDWAGVLIALNRVEQAQAKMRRVIEEFPDRSEARRARLWLGQLHIEKGRYDAAVDALTPLASDVLADASLRTDAWFALARVAVTEGLLTNALFALQQGELVTTNIDRRVEARIDQARLLMQANRMSEAIEVMNQAVATYSSHPAVARALLEQADLLRAQGRYEQAAEAYQRYVESYSDPAGLRHALYSKSWSLWALRRYAEAALTFEKAYGLLRNQVLREQALVKSADSYFMSGQYRLAAVTYERALIEYSADGSSPDLYYQAGESYARSGDTTNATRLLRAVVDLPEAGEVAATSLMRLARLYEEQHNWDEAVAVFEEIMARNAGTDHYPMALHGRAVLKYRLGRYVEALVDFTRLQTEFSGSTWAEQASFMRAWATYQLGDVQPGLDMAADFLEQYPESGWAADVYFWLAEHDYNRRDFDAAETHFAAIAARYPTNRMADQSLYWAGRAALEKKAYRLAIDEYFNPLVRRYPDSPLISETRFSQGDALTEIGDFAGAILAFNEIVTHYPDHPLAIRALGRIGDCQFTLGADRPARYHEAVETYRTLLARPQLTRDIAVQTEYKLARTYERIGLTQDAATHYMNVVYQWLAARQQGVPVDEVWFVRSAFSAAALKEAVEAWDDAIRIYARVVESDIMAAADATIRIDRINNQRQKTNAKSSNDARTSR